MRPVLEAFIPKSFEEIEIVQKKLRQCKDEWLERKPGKGNITYMGHNTMRQILDHAVKGITYWDFGVTDQWREEVYAYNKQTGQWYFDGYVYHVKGYMFIPGIGHREQYGCKVAVGGKDNQDSAYKAAASNCFTKCASMFGVGEEIYSKIKVELESNEEDLQYQQIQMDPNYAVGQYPQQNWGQPQTQNWSQQPSGNTQQNQQFYQQPNWNQQSQQGWNQQNYTQPSAEQNLQQSFYETDMAIANNAVETPFENVTPKAEAQPNQYEAQPQNQVQQNQYQAQPVQFGAPVNTTQTSTETMNNESNNQNQQNESPLNPWQEQGVIEELQRYARHKERLNIQDDSQIIPFLRDYFKNEKADLSYVTPENLKGINDYLDTISA